MSAIAINPQYVGWRISAALRRGFGDLRHSVKRIARVVGRDPRAARNWVDGTSLPPVAETILLMAESEEFAAAILEILEEIRCARSSSK